MAKERTTDESDPLKYKTVVNKTDILQLRNMSLLYMYVNIFSQKSTKITTNWAFMNWVTRQKKLVMTPAI